MYAAKQAGGNRVVVYQAKESKLEGFKLATTLFKHPFTAM
jgi:hypothetical protein